ncbi:hypothetical protein DYB30_000669 [Aphanomyces astaci]|uniref:RWP-RK domain-containing protein n=1 Tax=Aphanomyces astaci TaxID=112090 RepID=A0A397DXU9_APHAT|nr:hypothetical protein AaE_005904 [Aphanomyces astaci]RHY73063.1 hypothetical protein DYB30_000669 [Aphanomyces astaci]
MDLDLDHLHNDDDFHVMDLNVMHKNLYPDSPTNESASTHMRRRALSLNKITIEDFYDFFDKPIVAVAREFGVCTTLFKKICRKSGIHRWPYRKISSLSKTIDAIEDTLHQDLSAIERSKMMSQLDDLQKKRDYVRRNPNSKVALVKPTEALSLASRLKPTKPQPENQGFDDSNSEPYSVESPRDDIHQSHRAAYDFDDSIEDEFSQFPNLYSHHHLLPPTDLALDDYSCVVEI